MKVYLVSTVTCAMAGIESCRIFIVPQAQEAAFLQQYAGCILQTGCKQAAWPQVPVIKYKKGQQWPLFIQ